jgi:hypothetical protein
MASHRVALFVLLILPNALHSAPSVEGEPMYDGKTLKQLPIQMFGGRRSASLGVKNLDLLQHAVCQNDIAKFHLAMSIATWQPGHVARRSGCLWIPFDVSYVVCWVLLR